MYQPTLFDVKVNMVYTVVVLGLIALGLSPEWILVPVSLWVYDIVRYILVGYML